MSQPSQGSPPNVATSARRPAADIGDASKSRSETTSPSGLTLGLVCMALAATVWLVFGQTLNHEFVNYDNDVYVYENPQIKAGLSWQGIAWAFTHIHVDEWWPLTSLSHMADCELYGLNPWGHHLTNVLLHAATVIFLFLALHRLTGAFWRSAFVAAVFAIHPLRVESVAWVTERKDVLCGLFFALTLWAYVRYARQPFAIGRYLLVVLFFALGLLSKAAVVPLPFLLLLLDYWPLRRIAFASGFRLQKPRELKRVVLEKIPLLALALIACVTTIVAVKEVHPLDELTMPWRVANALVAYATYLWQMIYPAGLCVFYPHPQQHLAIWQIALSASALVVISVAVICAWRRQPYLLVGWLWYLGMLVPVIGLVQVGSQAHADRYTYLPQIGLYVMAAWGAVAWSANWRFRRTVRALAAVAILAGLGIGAYRQTTHWRNSESLWQRALAGTSNNYLAHNNLGSTFADQRKWPTAISHYEAAIRMKPNYAEAYYNLGVALAAQERLDDAIERYGQALRLKPNYVDALNNLGNALAAQGRLDEAILRYEAALRLRPDHPQAHYNFGNALTKQRKFDQAIQHYERALQIHPDFADAHFNLANRLAAQGKLDEAIEHFQRTVQLKPDFAEAHNNLGNRLAARRRWDEAAQSFNRALQLRPDYVEALNNFGAALAGQGKLDEAKSRYQQALRIKPDYAEARANLGNVFHLAGQPAAAMDHWHEALNLATAQTNTALAQAILKRLASLQSTPPAQAP